MNPAEKVDQILSWVFGYLEIDIPCTPGMVDVYVKMLDLIMEESP